MKFPKIDYKFWLSNWGESVGQKKAYTNKNMIEYIVFDGDINSCTNEIFDLVKSSRTNKASVLRVVDLIYSWGGRSGRLFYASTKGKFSPRKELETNEDTFSKYLKGVALAQAGKSDSIDQFCKVNGIGPSYASKHAYFWSINSENPLIIVDSKIAGALGYKTIDELEKRHNYKNIVESFKNKAVDEFEEANPSKIERALFAFHKYYFLNNNNDWKNNIEGHDYDEALKLAEILFDSGKE